MDYDAEQLEAHETKLKKLRYDLHELEGKIAATEIQIVNQRLARDGITLGETRVMDRDTLKEVTKAEWRSHVPGYSMYGVKVNKDGTASRSAPSYIGHIGPFYGVSLVEEVTD